MTRATPVTYSCDQFNVKMKRKGSLPRHIESNHGSFTYSCDLCEFKTKLKSYLKLHIESVNGNVTNVTAVTNVNINQKEKETLKST